MKRTKKIVTLAMAMVLLVCTTVMATLAYLQDETEVVKNTFTVGNVVIDLDEAAVDEYGEQEYKDDAKTEIADRVKANEYKLIPGHTYLKDPTVHVETDSEASYVFMKVVINNYSDVIKVYGEGFLPQDVVTGWVPTTWISTEEVKLDPTADTATYVFYYHKKVADTLKAEEPLVLEPLFTSIVMDETFDYDDVSTLQAASIDITAYAIQADGFDITNADDLAEMQAALKLN